MSTPTALSRSLLAVLFVVACSLLDACGGSLECPRCGITDQIFYAKSDVRVDPGLRDLAPGETTTAQVTVVYADPYDTTFASYHFAGLTVVGSPPDMVVDLIPLAGQDENRVQGPVASPPCTATELAATEGQVSGLLCAHYTLRVTTSDQAADTTILLSAQWASRSGSVIERLGTFALVFPTRTTPPVPDFQVAVGRQTGGVYGTRATLPVSITRTGGFAEGVTLAFNGLTSGVRGAFAAEPMPTDSRSLELQIPARYAGGGQVPMRVTATTTSGLTKVVDFTQFVEPLFKLFLDPQSATLTAAVPLQVQIGLKAGDLFRTPSIGVVELSISPDTPLPDGVTARFLDDPLPVVPALPVETVSRTLQLVTDGRPNVMGQLHVRGTARGVPPDYDLVAPFLDITLDLTVAQGQFWQFVGTNLTYGIANAETIGVALQSDNQPVVAWLEGRSSSKSGYMRRFDGTTFAPSPPRIGSPSSSPPRLSAPSGGVGIAEASFALSSSDAGLVAFSYEGGARLALGRADRAGVGWSIGSPIVVGDQADPTTSRARSPRIVSGPADRVVVSYIREANAATTSGGVLQVLWTGGSNVLHPLATSLPGGALNASPVGSVVLDSTALALRADGNPWVAWVEEPTNAVLPNRVWLRAYDGNDWGPAIGVPTTPGMPVGTAVQLLVEPSGMVVVAWLEGSPAQLKLQRYDPSSQAWAPLANTGNGRGSLNVTDSTPVLDVHLARHADGRLLVTWTEGGADPQVWIKRLEADSVWRLVGTTVSQVDRYSKTPRIVSDANNRLYVAWAQHAALRGPDAVNPYAEIEVAQWIFP